jgi:hypothetical protein
MNWAQTLLDKEGALEVFWSALEIHTRAQNSLEAAGFVFPLELCFTKDEELLRLRGFGRASLRDTRAALQRAGYSEIRDEIHNLLDVRQAFLKLREDSAWKDENSRRDLIINFLKKHGGVQNHNQITEIRDDNGPKAEDRVVEVDISVDSKSQVKTSRNSSPKLSVEFIKAVLPTKITDALTPEALKAIAGDKVLFSRISKNIQETVAAKLANPGNLENDAVKKRLALTLDHLKSVLPHKTQTGLTNQFLQAVLDEHFIDDEIYAAVIAATERNLDLPHNSLESIS